VGSLGHDALGDEERIAKLVADGKDGVEVRGGGVT
jgi:hypothetical protein